MILRAIRHEHPSEPGAWVDIRPLTRMERAEAITNEVARSTKMLRTMNLGELLPLVQKAQAAAREKREAEGEDEPEGVLATLHFPTAARYAIVAWSYPEDPRAVDPATGKMHLEILDTETEEWLVGLLQAMNLRPLQRSKPSASTSGSSEPSQPS